MKKSDVFCLLVGWLVLSIDIRLLVSTESFGLLGLCGSGAMRTGAKGHLSEWNAITASKGCLASTEGSEDTTMPLVLT